MREHGFFAVERRRFDDIDRRAPPPNAATPDVLRSYAGVDGLDWPFVAEEPPLTPLLDDGLLPEAHWPNLEAALASGALGEEARILWLSVEPVSDPDPPAGFVLVGYDVGFHPSGGAYSAVFHEVLFGLLPELREFASELNTHWLFGTSSAARAYVRKRAEVQARGADVEDAAPVLVLAVAVRAT